MGSRKKLQKYILNAKMEEIRETWVHHKQTDL